VSQSSPVPAEPAASVLVPAGTTAGLDPFRETKTLMLNVFIHDRLTEEQYTRYPRNVAKKAEAYLKSTGIADTACFGAEGKSSSCERPRNSRHAAISSSADACVVSRTLTDSVCPSRTGTRVRALVFALLDFQVYESLAGAAAHKATAALRGAVKPGGRSSSRPEANSNGSRRQ